MMKKNQQGVALVVAMLIVAIATIVATQIFYQQQIAIRRTLNQLQAEQLYQLALSSEAWAKVMLKEDLANEELTKVHADYFGDTWARPISMPISEGTTVKINIKITDAQSCFNINNLVLNGNTAQPDQIKILQNLMTQLKLNPELVWTVVDWIDENDDPNPTGAEFETYSRLIPAYRTANFRIIELNELYAISGWNAETINTLMPYICALQPAPKTTKVGHFFVNNTEVTKINVNTVSKEVLTALFPTTIGNVNLINILEIRKTKPFKSVNEFWTQFEKDNPSFWTQVSNNTMKVNEAKTNKSKATLSSFLSVNSQYFFMDYSALLDQLEQNYRSLIYRPAPAAAVTANAPATAAAEPKTPATENTENPDNAENPSAQPATTATTANSTVTAQPPATATATPNTANTTQANSTATTTQPPTTPLATSANKTAENTQISTLYRSQYY
jgi:general secretion pathway protein K